MAAPTIPNGEEYFFPIIYEGNGGGQRVGRFVPFTDNGTIDNSCIFNGPDTAQLTRTPSSGGNQDTFTFSCWAKRGRLGQSGGGGSHQVFLSAGNDVSNFTFFGFRDSASLPSGGVGESLNFVATVGGSVIFELSTSRTFEDTSSYNHYMVVYDSGNSTSGDRIKLYVNGERVTDFNVETYPSQNQDSDVNENGVVHRVGAFNLGTNKGHFDGYLAEVNLIDGTALTPDTFGVTDTSTGRWIPKTLSGITYGTNGFRMKFQDSSALGDDTSGNGNDFSATNLASTDQTTDSPTSNHCTWDPNDHANLASFSEGNLKVTGGSASTSGSCRGTLAPKSGKYYFEVKFLGGAFAGHNSLGIRNKNVAINSTTSGSGVTTESYHWRDDGYAINGTLGQMNSGFSSYTTNDYIGVAMDLDTGKVWMSKNGTYEKSGNPVTGENPMFTIPTGQPYAPWWLGYGYTNNNELNCGQRAFNTDPPTGFVALQQDNLPTTDRGVSGLVWMKNRDTTDASQWYDSSRGKHIYFVTNSTAAESTATDGLQKFLAGGQQIEDSDAINTSGESFVSWNWVGNGATEVTNNDGSNTTTVQANTAAGFSIVKFTPPASGTSGITYGHGLTQTPEWFLWKRRNSSMRFLCYHHRSYANSNGGYALEFSSSNANSAFNTEFGSTSIFTAAPTATTFALRNNSATAGGAEHMAYCWHGVEGFSKFGQYNANNSADGPFVYLGFKPKFLIIKSSSAISWYIIDATRSPINPVTAGFTVDNSQAEFTNQFTIDFLSNGFKIRNDSSVYGGSTNNSSYSPYYYMAFAEHPFVGDGTSPVTAR
jgi:hypothetical protein